MKPKTYRHTIASLASACCVSVILNATANAVTANEFAVLDYAPTPVSKKSCVPGQWSVNTAYTLPGKTVQHQTEHFAFSWAGNDVAPDQSKAFGENLEKIWDTYMNTVGWTEPYCDTADKKKVNVMIDPSYYANGAGTGDRDPAFWVRNDLGYTISVLAHEFAHSLQFHSRGIRDTGTGGQFWESHAQYMTRQALPYNLLCYGELVDAPHLYYATTRNRYCNFQFWEFLKNKFGHSVMNDIWTSALQGNQPGRNIEEPLGILMRNLNIDAKGLGDLFGEWAARNVTWDYRTPEGIDHTPHMRAHWGTYGEVDFAGGSYERVRRHSRLIKQLDGRFAIPSYWAPQRYGYNLVKLKPAAGAKSISVDFTGIPQDAPMDALDTAFANQGSLINSPASDWRWSVVAMDAEGKPRYSNIQRGVKGSLNFDLKLGDQSVWLVVVATPTELHKAYWDQAYNTFYRYPWSVQLAGAVPDGHQAGAPDPTTCGKRHPNGRGWVACAAKVSNSVYVGPDAIVLSGTLTDEARVEGHAIVRDSTLSGRARVGGLTYLWESSVADDAYVASTMTSHVVRGKKISGTAKLWGDLDIQAASISSGTYTGVVTDGDLTNPASGGQRYYLPIDLTQGGKTARYLIQKGTNQCIAANLQNNSNSAGREYVLELNRCNSQITTQRWTLTDLSPASPVIKSARSKMCLQTAGNQLAVGTSVTLAQCNATAQGQKWRYDLIATRGLIQSVDQPDICIITRGEALQTGLCKDTTSKDTQWLYFR